VNTVTGTRATPGDRAAPFVSVVLPVFNENGHLTMEIERIMAALEGSELSYEIIVVDDGSTDGSTEQLLERDDIRLIRFTRNMGPGAARAAGTRSARGDVVVWTDADMSYPNEEIPRLVKELDGVDQVVGARTSEQGSHRLLRVPAKWSIRKLAEYLSRTEIPDLNSGFRAFRREVAEQFLHLLPAGFSHVTTITMAFLMNGYEVKYFPIEYAKRQGRSKFHWYRDTKLYAMQVVRMIMMWNPLRVLMPLAAVLLAVGSGKLVYDLFDKHFRVGTNTLLLFSAAFMVLLVALLADLVVQVTKPKDLVRSSSAFEVP